jgi:hypothetical protein
MSADSIEPNEILKIPKYSPIKTFLNQWNTPKTPLLEPIDTDGKDFLSISPVTNRKPEQLVREYFFKFDSLVLCRIEELI